MTVVTEEKRSERQIVGTRVYDAPRELVWKLWTEAEHVAKWWGPHGFTLTTETMDVRPGGVWNFVMHGPDGRDYANKIVYRDVVAPERLTWSHVSGPLFEAEAAFEADGGKTRVTMTMTFATAELRNRVAEEYGAVEGLQQTLARLDDKLASVRGPLVLSRTFDAPRELVWHAWTNAEHLAKWWGPKHFDNPVCEADVRPGGAIRIDMRGPDGSVYPMGGWFTEVEAPRRLVFTSTALHDAERRPQLENLNIVTFEERDGRTTIDLRVYTVVAAEAASFALSGMREGWTGSFEKLDAIASGTKEFTISRELDAPRELVYRLWTEPEHVKAWFGPKGMPILQLEQDLRVGGTMHYGMRMPDGTLFWGLWTYLEIVPPSRLSFTTAFADERRNVVHHPMAPAWPLVWLSTVTFEELGERTRVTLRGIAHGDDEEARKTFEAGFESMTGGWSGTFEQLEGYLASVR